VWPSACLLPVLDERGRKKYFLKTVVESLMRVFLKRQRKLSGSSEITPPEKRIKKVALLNINRAAFRVFSQSR
jgi:hypothetical protein